MGGSASVNEALRQRSWVRSEEATRAVALLRTCLLSTGIHHATPPPPSPAKCSEITDPICIYFSIRLRKFQTAYAHKL